MLVRIEKDWDYPDNFFRQTPGNSHRWGDISFTTDAVEACDYLICLQRPSRSINVSIPPGNAWIIMQEPPVKWFEFYKRSYRYFDKVYTYFPYRRDNYEGTLQPVLPWHIHKSYDELSAITRDKLGRKEDTLTWVTSNKSNWPGQKQRMVLVELLKSNLEAFALYGQGFEYVEDKFDVLFPSRYVMAIENFSTKDYWTEKFMDAILSWCLPFYWGAPNLEEYFPAESFIRVDISNPKESEARIKSAMEKNEWEKRLPAIAEARDLILNKYQFFPYITEMIRKSAAAQQESRKYSIPANPFPTSHIIQNQIQYYIRKIRSLMRAG